MREVTARPGERIQIAGQQVTIVRMGVETRGAHPPVVELTSPKPIRIWDEPQEGAIVGVQAIFLEGSWIRMAAQPLGPNKHFRWLGIQLTRVGGVGTWSNLLTNVLSFLSQGVPLPRVGEVRFPYAEMASDLVGTFIHYRFATAVWGEWSGTPGLVEEDRMYGATATEMKVTVIGHFD